MNMRFHYTAIALAMLTLAGCSQDQPDDTAGKDKVSAAVTTQPVRQGDLADIVSAYGTATPAIDAASTLSVHAEGSVTQFHVTAGTAVKRGQALLTFTLSPSAQANYQQALSTLRVARGQREHTAQLLANQLVTNDQMAQADKALADARSALDALHAQQGDRPNIELLAPNDGVVSAIAATKGELLQPGATLLTLAGANGTVVSVGVEMNPQHAVIAGDTVTLVPLGPGTSLAGAVKRVAAQLDARTHLLDADITPAGNVVGGMGYRADITIGHWHGWLLPHDAITGDDNEHFVFQVVAGKAVKVPVKVLGESDDVTVVNGAIDASKPLVIVGNTQLDDGMAVRAMGSAR